VAVAGGADELEVLDVLASLVRKSLLTAERVASGTRHAMLETVRQFGEERLAASGLGDEVRDLYARHYRAMEAPVMEVWNGPDQKQAYEWLNRELANLRAAFQWAAQQGDLDTAATIAVFAAVLADMSGLSAEPITWAEQLLPAATEARHRLLLALYQTAGWCAFHGRSAQGMAYAEASRALYGDPAFEQNIYGIGAVKANTVYAHAPSPGTTDYTLDRWVSVCREVVEVDDPLLTCRSHLAMALSITGPAQEALALCEGLVPAAVATGNPYAHAIALNALSLAQADNDLASAVAAGRECQAVCRQFGLRNMEMLVYPDLARLEIAAGDYSSTLDHLADNINFKFDAGDFSSLKWPLAVVAVLLVRCHVPESAAVIAGFATAPFTLGTNREFAAAVERLHQALGDRDFDVLGQRGRSMPGHEMVAYSLQAVEEVRTRLDQLTHK
jgi:hypothetical protein